MIHRKHNFLEKMQSLRGLIKNRAKIKIVKFGTINALFGYFCAETLKRAIIKFEISTPKFF